MSTGVDDPTRGAGYRRTGNDVLRRVAAKVDVAICVCVMCILYAIHSHKRVGCHPGCGKDVLFLVSKSRLPFGGGTCLAYSVRPQTHSLCHSWTRKTRAIVHLRPLGGWRDLCKKRKHEQPENRRTQPFPRKDKFDYQPGRVDAGHHRQSGAFPGDTPQPELRQLSCES